MEEQVDVKIDRDEITEITMKTKLKNSFSPIIIPVSSANLAIAS